MAKTETIERRLRGLNREVRTRGDLKEAFSPFVAIVGARQATDEGMAFALRLASKLASAGVVVGSGGAKGIDTAAHEGALRVGGTTFVLRPSGLNVTYPQENEELFARIAMAPGCGHIALAPDEDGYHPKLARIRNLALVLLADAVVVVQAKVQSGSLITARAAEDARRPLFVVPGSPWDAIHGGCNLLLRRGALPLLRSADASAKEILTAIGQKDLFANLPEEDPLPEEGPVQEEATRPQSKRAQKPPKGPEDAPPRERPVSPAVFAKLSEEERALLAILGSEPLSIDAIALKLQTSPTALASALLTLTLEGVLVEAPFQHFRRS